MKKTQTKKSHAVPLSPSLVHCTLTQGEPVLGPLYAALEVAHFAGEEGGVPFRDRGVLRGLHEVLQLAAHPGTACGQQMISIKGKVHRDFRLHILSPFFKPLFLVF